MYWLVYENDPSLRCPSCGRYGCSMADTIGWVVCKCGEVLGEDIDFVGPPEPCSR